MLNEVSVEYKMLISTERVTLKFVEKIAKTGIPAILSKSASTLSAVKLAQKEKILLIGFVKDKRLNVYSEINKIYLD